MPVREVVEIDEKLCDGCGDCVTACAEGAIAIIDGKARLISDVYCDGLGACLGHCPQGAITVIQRDADTFDETAVERHLATIRTVGPSRVPGPSLNVVAQAPVAASGCPGSRAQTFNPVAPSIDSAAAGPASQLRHWPVQLHLVPPTAPFFQDADVLFAATCAPFAYPEFHRDIMKDKALIIACPKLDKTEPYVEKITAMITHGNIKSLTVAHMEVPCCGGLQMMVRQAVADSGKDIPVETICIGLKGDVIER